MEDFEKVKKVWNVENWNSVAREEMPEKIEFVLGIIFEIDIYCISEDFHPNKLVSFLRFD